MPYDPREWDLTSEADALRRAQDLSQKLAASEEAPGFHSLPETRSCRDPEHGLPNYLHIPSGMRYVHYCPTCRQKSVAYSPHVSC